MTTYKITAARENGTTFSDNVHEASESSARKAFREIYRHGEKFTITNVEVVKEA